MLILAILFTLVLAAAFAVVPARLGRRKPTRADGCYALLPAVLVWLWAACIWSKPGLTIGFDAFRCLGITAMVLWACGGRSIRPAAQQGNGIHPDSNCAGSA